MKKILCYRYSAIMVFIFLLTACKNEQIILDVNYSRPLESVLVPDQDGFVEDGRYGLRFSVFPLQFVEKGDSSDLQIKRLRMVRVRSGHYLVTAPGFQNVYVLAPTSGGLIIDQKLFITDSELVSPFFNVRGDQIHLVDPKTDLSAILVEFNSKVEVRS